MKYCPECGNDCRDDDKFCVICGFRFSDREQSTPIPPPQPVFYPQQDPRYQNNMIPGSQIIPVRQADNYNDNNIVSRKKKKTLLKALLFSGAGIVLAACAAVFIIFILPSIMKSDQIEDDGYNMFYDNVMIAKKNDTYCLMNKDGQIVKDLAVTEISPFQNGLARAKGINGYGFINSKGEWVIDAKYDLVGYFSEGYAYFRQNDLYGYIDQKGNIVIPAKYKQAYNFSEGLASVEDFSGKCGCIDTKGEYVINTRYTSIGEFIDGSALVMLSDGNLYKYGLINNKGEEIIRCQQQDIKFPYYKKEAKNFIYYQQKVIPVKYNGKWGFVDMNNPNDYICTPCYDAVIEGYVYNNDVAHSDIVPVYMNDKWGYYDLKSRKQVVNCEFESAGIFYSDNAPVCMNGKFKLMKYENISNSPQYLDGKEYTSLYYFGDNTFIFTTDENNLVKGVLDANTGEELISPADRGISYDTFKNGCAVYSTHDSSLYDSYLYGLINKKGDIIIEAKYKHISKLTDDGYLAASDNNGSVYILDKNGNVVINTPLSELYIDNDYFSGEYGYAGQK